MDNHKFLLKKKKKPNISGERSWSGVAQTQDLKIVPPPLP